MTWAAVAIAGAAAIGAGASYAGSKKQADAAKKGAKTNLDMFNTLNAQQQPFIQSGYGATSKLNTLLGIGGPSMGGGVPAQGNAPPVVNNGPNGPGVPIQQHIPYGAPENAPPLPLRHILTMRAQQGDREAQQLLGGF